MLYRARLATFLGESMPEPGDLDVSKQVYDMILEAASVYAAAVSEQTRSDYLRRWAKFEEWCADHGQAALPADPTTVMAYLAERRRDASLSTVRGALAAISRVHFEAGFPPPRSDPAMAVFIRGLGRVAGGGSVGKPISALRISDLKVACETLDAGAHDPRRIRDRCVLLLSSAGLSSSDMSRLRWDGVRIRQKKVQVGWIDSEGVAQTRPNLTASDGTSPLAALVAWRELVPVSNGPVFIRMDRGGTVKQVPLKAREITRIVEVRGRALNADGTRRPAEIDDLLQNEPSHDLRDKAILLLGFAGAFRRKELTSLMWSDLEEAEGGLKVRLRRSKTDPTGRGVIVGIPRGRVGTTCPVRAVTVWKGRAQRHGLADAERPVFVPITRGGRLGERPMKPESVTRVVESRARLAGLAGNWGGRSLRAGFISTAADLDIPLDLIARQSRHATLDNLVRYIRHEDPFRRNAADWMGL